MSNYSFSLCSWWRWCSRGFSIGTSTERFVIEWSEMQH